MAKNYTVYVPAGNTLEMVTDALSSGRYLQVANPGSEPNTPVALAASADVTIGPFNDARSYRVTLTQGDSCVFTKVASGVLTAVDDALIARPYLATLLLVNGALTVFNGTNIITKGSIFTGTLAAPIAAQEGSIFTITNKLAFAHVITATALVNAGDAGSPYTTLTWPAFVGASITLVACNLLWNVISNNGVVLS